MPRPHMSDEEKRSAEEFRNTPEGLRKKLQSLKEKESKLLADLAMREHPELEEPLAEISFLMDRVTEANSDYESDWTEHAEQERSKLRKKINEFIDKANALEDEFAECSAERFEQINKSALIKAMKNLAEALLKHSPAFKERGVEPSTLLPQLKQMDKIKV